MSAGKKLFSWMTGDLLADQQVKRSALEGASGAHGSSEQEPAPRHSQPAESACVRPRQIWGADAEVQVRTDRKRYRQRASVSEGRAGGVRLAYKAAQARLAEVKPS